MLSTLTAVGVYLGMFLSSAGIYACFLYLGLRWARVDGLTRFAASRVAVIILVAQIVCQCLLLTISAKIPASILAISNLAMAALLPCLIIGRSFKLRFLRSIQAFLPTLLATVINVGIGLFIVQFVLEAFYLPTNHMAPTLLGQHARGVCPTCGAQNYGSPLSPEEASKYSELMICTNFHVSLSSFQNGHVYQSDKILAAKFLAPRRWDMVVFQFPDDPTTMYVMRLVGLPGESIEIKDGFVVINGETLTPPDSIRDIEYADEIPGMREFQFWGADEPVELGEDEYFVLGDFSQRSRDSRMWEVGAPGHPPYAVPKSYIKGVVTHTYWPPERWQIHR